VKSAATNAQDTKLAWLEEGIPSGSRTIWKATPASSSWGF